MSSGLTFGSLPAFADLTPDQQAQVMAALQQGQPAPPPVAQSPMGGLLGQVDPQATGAIPSPPGSPVAMDEAQTQRLERQQASPQELATLGGSPVDRLLYDRAGMGGGANPFSGSAGGFIPQADGLGARPVPMPPARPSDDALAVQPATTGSVPGLPQGQTVASSKAVPGSAPNQYLPATPADRALEPTGGRPLAGDFDPLTGQPISGSPRPLGTPQGAVSPSGAAAATAASLGQGGSVIDRFVNGLNNPDVGNLLRSLSIGLLIQRGIGPGLGAGLQNYQTSQAGSLKNQLEQIKFMQGQQDRQDTYSHLVNNLKLDPVTARAAMGNPTLLSSVMAQQKPSYQTIGGNIYDLSKNGGVPGPANLIGSADRPDAEKLAYLDKQKDVEDKHKEDTLIDVTDQATGKHFLVNKSAYARAMSGDAGTSQGGQPGGAAPATNQFTVPLPGGINPADAAEQRVAGEARGKVLSSAIEAGDPARKRIAVVDQMAAALNQAAPNMTTGPLSGSVMTAKEALAGVLGRPIEGLSGQEMLNSMGPILAGEAAKGITSRPALAEFKAIANVKPGQQFSVEGNRALLDVIRQNAQREVDLSNLAETASSHADFMKKREAYEHDNPLINPFTQKPFGSASGAGPGMSLQGGGATGAPTGSPAGGAAARFQDLMNSGMSKADAFAQMHREGL